MNKYLQFQALKLKKNILLVIALVCFCSGAFAQAVQIAGRVTADDGSALTGVSVKIKGTNSGTLTDVTGSYKLSAPSNATLIFSFIGYNTQEVAVSGRTAVNVQLTADVKSLQQVVVVGYGTTQRKDLTGSVASVSADQVAKAAVTSVDQALQGRAAGVQVTNNDGAPGGGVTVTIRGVGSLATGANDPLYVVDGYPIPGGLNNINPNDIASIDILKDASATAIYGVRAANGVVLVTTKKGRKGGGVQISLDAYSSIQSKPKEYKVLTAQQWATLANQDKATEGAFQELPQWTDPASLTNIDWQNAVYRTGLKQDYNLAIRGGNEKLQSAISLGYYSQKGIVLDSYFKRINLGFNLDYQPYKWLRSSTSVKYSRENQNNPFGTGALQQLGELIPTLDGGNKLTSQIKDDKGNYGFYNPVNIYTKSWNNPVYTIENNSYQNLSNYLLTSSSLEATLFDGFKIKTNAGVNASYAYGYFFQPEDDRISNQYNLSSPTANALYSQYANNSFDWLWENTISYNKTFGKHNIDVVAGVSEESNVYTQIGGSGDKQLSNTFRDLGQVNDLTAYGNETPTTYASQFGRFSYKYADKYLVTATVRRDGSSKFAPGHQYGVFPSAAVAWKIKEEDFLKNASWLNDLKLRGSYGQVGNQGGIGTFAYQAQYSTGGPATSGGNYGYAFGKNGSAGEIYQNGLAIVQLANPNLKWETDNMTDIGLDASFLHGDLSVVVDYYDRRSKDFLLYLPRPSQSGVSSAQPQNVGSIDNKGLEFAVNYNHRSADFQYGIGLTLTTVQNKILSLTSTFNALYNVSLPGGVGADGWGQVSQSVVGGSIGEFYGYKSLGIYQTQAQIDALNAKAAVANPSSPYYWKSVTQPGDRYYADVNGDGQITAADRVRLGSPIPKFYGGLNLDASYKAFDFAAYFYGSYGNKIFDYEARNLESFQAPGFVGVENVSYNYYVNHWTSTNPSNRYARVTYNDDVSGNNIASSVYVENGSYLRLKTLTVGYTLPSTISKSISVSKIRVYVSTQNLFTITGYKGLDPEIGIQNGSATLSGIDQGTYPSSKFYTLGVNATF